MADFEYSIDGQIGVMRFNRPEKLNAITYAMLDQIDDAVRSAATDERVRAVVLTGSGRAFSAGTDLQELSSRPGNEGGGRSGRSPAPDAPAPWTMSVLKKPTVCAVNGAAVGLGVELTSQCDVRVAGESARFGWVFVHRGLVPDTGAGTWLPEPDRRSPDGCLPALLRRDHLGATGARARLCDGGSARCRPDGAGDGGREPPLARRPSGDGRGQAAALPGGDAPRGRTTSRTTPRRSDGCLRARTSRKE